MQNDNENEWQTVSTKKSLDDIPTLQAKIKKLFVSIPIDKSRRSESYQFSDYIEHNIFSEGQEQFSDLRTKTLYQDFLQFSHDQISRLQNELRSNTGDILQIITVSGLVLEIKTEIAKMKQYYYDSYIAPLKLDKQHYTTRKGQIYPNFHDDLLERAWQVIKEKYTELYNKTDIEIKDILKSRLEGLKYCTEVKNYPLNKSISSKSNYHTSYFTKELERETQLDEKINSLPPNEYNREMCGNIFWGYKMIKAYDKPIDKKNLDVLLADKKEVGFLKTFLPPTFYEGDELNTKLLAVKKNWEDIAPYRQTVFGFYSDLKDSIYINTPQLYECMSIQNNYLSPEARCSDYVEWCSKLNDIYTHCAINKDKSLFPVRFILSDIYYEGLEKYFDTKKTERKRLPSLFENYQFIGLLTLKYVYHNSRRLQIIPLFKLIKSSIFYNATTGDSYNILLMSLSTNLIHYGDLFKRTPITHTEFKNLFFNYRDKLKLRYFMSSDDNKKIFITNKVMFTETDSDIIRNLKMYEINSNSTVFEGKRHYVLQRAGGKSSTNYKIALSKNYELYKTTIIENKNIYNDFITKNIDIYDIFKLVQINNKWTWKSETYNQLVNYLRVKYNLLLVDNNAVKLGKKHSERNKLHIYRPFTNSYYIQNELIKKYNLFGELKHSDNICIISYYASFIENCLKNNHTNCELFIVNNPMTNKYRNIVDENIKQLKSYSGVLKYNFLNNQNIYELLNLDFPKSKLLYYSVINLDFDIGYIFCQPNIFNTYIGMLLALKHLEKGGIFIHFIDTIIYKENADIYLILKKYFKHVDIYCPEIYNKFKMGGISLVCQDFQGIPTDELQELLDIASTMQKLYPSGILDFQVYDEDTRKHLLIDKPLDTSSKPRPYITGFIDAKSTDDIYSEVRAFNDRLYLDRKIFCDELIKLIQTTPVDKLPAVPTEQQLVDGILYCKKYGIEYYDKYNNKLWTDAIGQQIITEMYGSSNPIHYNFKTAAKITLKQLREFRASTKQRISMTKKVSRSTKFGELFESDKTHISKKQSSGSGMSLLAELEPIEKQLYNTGLLIDNRRDFSLEDPEKQIHMYNELKTRFRYYKGKRMEGRLDMIIMKRNNMRNINQGYLKLYEILNDCGVIPKTIAAGIYRSFHFCELPGGFINCINNYITTKTEIQNYEWVGTSLSPKFAAIKDDYGFLRRYPNRWDFGVDGTGDITNVANIKHYASRCKSLKPNLMTTDCGLEWGNPKYELVAFASLLAMLYCLPAGGSLVYKVMTPIELPLTYNLFYLCYTHFRDMIIFKPVQNNQSREFYLICKKYTPIDSTTMDKLIGYLARCKMTTSKLIEKEDIFGDKYPAAFVYQMREILEKLADNWDLAIRRIIYIQDNWEDIDSGFVKLLGDYLDDKNEEWIKRYDIKRSPKEL